MTASELLRQIDAAERADIADTLTSAERAVLHGFVGGECVETAYTLARSTWLLVEDVQVALATLDCLGLIDDEMAVGWSLTAKGRDVCKLIDRGGVRAANMAALGDLLASTMPDPDDDDLCERGLKDFL